MSRTLLRAAVVGFAALSVFTAGPVAAQQFPNKILRVVNPNAPGGNSDVLFRLLAPKMGEALGQQLVIDYRPGAGGNIGAELVARAAPDGYTTLIAAASFLFNPALLKNIPFDAEKDFTPLGVIADIPAGLVVHPSLPVKTVQDLIALAKPRPNQLNFSSSGQGALGHLSGALLNATAGINTVHIPYKGANLVVADMLGGQVDMMFNTFASLLHFVKAGKLRGLGVASPKRTVWLPEVPTMAEAGLPDFEAENWHGYAAPAGTPQPVIDRIYRDIARIVDTSEARERLLAMGLVPDTTAPTPEQFGAMIKRDLARYAIAIKAAGATAR